MLLQTNRQENSNAIKASLSSLGQAGKPFTLNFHPAPPQIDAAIAAINPQHKGKLFSLVAEVLKVLVTNTAGYAHRAALSSCSTSIVRVVLDKSKPIPSCCFRNGELVLLFPVQALCNPASFQKLGKGLPDALKVGNANLGSARGRGGPVRGANVVRGDRGGNRGRGGSTRGANVERGTGGGNYASLAVGGAYGGCGVPVRGTNAVRGDRGGNRGRGALQRGTNVVRGDRGGNRGRGSPTRGAIPARGANAPRGTGGSYASLSVGVGAMKVTSTPKPVSVESKPTPKVAPVPEATPKPTKKVLDVGPLSKALKEDFEENKETIEDYLKEVGDSLDTGPFSLRVEAQKCDDAAAADGTCKDVKNVLFTTLSSSLLSFYISLSGVPDWMKKAVLKYCPTRVLSVIVDEDKGGFINEHIYFENGELCLYVTAFTMGYWNEESSKCGSEIGEQLAKAYHRAATNGFDFGDEVVKLRTDAHKEMLNDGLRGLAFWSDSDLIKIETQYPMEEMDSRITNGNHCLRGKIWVVLAHIVKKLDSNIKDQKRFLACMTKETIVFQIMEDTRSELTRRHRYCYLQMVLKEDREKVYFAGPLKYYDLYEETGWEYSGDDFKEEYLHVYGEALSDSEDSDDDSDDYGGGGSYSPPSSSSSSSRTRQCNMCKGTGHRVCNSCHGNGCKGRVGCKGTGRANAKCSSCKGTGSK